MVSKSMTLNTKFYTVTETTGSNYSSSQTNILDVSRLLQNKPYWRQPFGNVIVKKKTLIINISDIVNRSKFEESVVIAEKLHALHMQGFDIYFYADGNFSKFKTPLDAVPGIEHIEIISDRKLAGIAARQLQLSHDELFVINETELFETEEGMKYELAKMVDPRGENISAHYLQT